VEEKEAFLQAPAELVASETAEIRLNKELKLDRVSVNLGDLVHVGDPLIQIAEQPLTLQLTALRAQLREQEMLLEKNNYFYRNRDRLLADGKIDQTQFDSVENEVQTNEATIERIRADVAMLDADSKSTAMTSPLEGIVTEKNVTSGVVAKGGELLLKIVRVDPIQALFSLPVSQAKGVVVGTVVSMVLEDFPNTPLQATVNYVGAELNPNTQSFDVRASISNTDRTLKVGMKGEIRFQSKSKQLSLFVPKESLLAESGRYYVFVVRDGKARRQEVYVHSTSDRLIEITDGLTPNDTIVVKGLDQIQEGATVDAWK